MRRNASLLAAYDEQLRTDAETPSALAVARLGPLWLVTFAGGQGFITYRDLAGADVRAIQSLVAEAVAHYRRNPAINRVEFKTRGHDHAPSLHDALLSNGFNPDKPESIIAMQAAAFEDPDSDEEADALLRRLTFDDGMELWVAESQGEIIGAGRLEPGSSATGAAVLEEEPDDLGGRVRAL